MNTLTITIAGGSGFLGSVLISYFQNKVKTIYVLTRKKPCSHHNVRYVQWDTKSIENWTYVINKTDILINLSGKSVDCRYHKKNKDLILNSRIESTLILHKAILQCHTPPKIWINSSTATIYEHSLYQQMDEKNGKIGNGFSVNVAKEWERTFFKHSLPGIRKIAIRTSIVLSTKGGALPSILKLVKLGFGGKQGKGNQKISWIHELDFARSIEHIITNKNIDGTINIVSPTPVSNTDFMKHVSKFSKPLFRIPISVVALKIGAFFIKTEAELVLKSRNVIPNKLKFYGFNFLYPKIDQALHSIIKSK